jgi:hypothetical protein
MVPLRRKRALSAPESHKAARTDAGPDPWAALGPLGDRATRTATALAELAVETAHMPGTWRAQGAVAEAATHEILTAHRDSWRNGVALGKWLQTQETGHTRRDLDQLTSLQAKLSDLQLRFDMLQVQYDEAVAGRHISNLTSD